MTTSHYQKFLRSIDNQIFLPMVRGAPLRALRAVNKQKKKISAHNFIPQHSQTFSTFFPSPPNYIIQEEKRRKSTPEGMFILLPLSVTHATSLITWG